MFKVLRGGSEGIGDLNERKVSQSYTYMSNNLIHKYELYYTNHLLLSLLSKVELPALQRCHITNA